MDPILDKTLQFFLPHVAARLSEEIDWRERGYGRNVFVRAAIYTAALVRDLVRIPTHHPAGIGHAHFRVRVEYIADTAIPTLMFFRDNFPISEHQRTLFSEAIELLERGVGLISDGAYPTIDEWYATMEEFHQLSVYSHKAASKIMEVVQFDPAAETT